MKNESRNTSARRAMRRHAIHARRAPAAASSERARSGAASSDRAVAASALRPGWSRSLFRSAFMGGFECSTHVRRDGRRLDLIASTRHDRFAAEDYARLARAGLLAARDGVRWHLVD